MKVHLSTSAEEEIAKREERLKLGADTEFCLLDDGGFEEVTDSYKLSYYAPEQSRGDQVADTVYPNVVGHSS